MKEFDEAFERIIQNLNFQLKAYDGVTQLIAKIKQRSIGLPGSEDDGTSCDTGLKGVGKEAGLLTVKGRYGRDIEKELPQFDIWEQWMKDIPGIGPILAAKLIIHFNYKFVSICQKCGEDLEKTEGAMICTGCGESSKDDGVLKYRLSQRDFPTISKWWAFMGRHTVDGNMPKRAKGVVANWSTPGRTLGFHIGDQFNRQKEDHPYKAFMLSRKAKHQKNHPDWSKGHVHNAARNEAVKLFLSHFWHVSRTLAGKPVSDPYSGVIMGHTNIVKPFYFAG
ncbi:hypothetical protein ER57_08065 [Smithella sp. SCADC]|jgi:hypothetical protein|nr:hypothetical protein ER57_08065 [Smithella sp. SCADC]